MKAILTSSLGGRTKTDGKSFPDKLIETDLHRCKMHTVIICF